MIDILKPLEVDFIPSKLEEGILYISIQNNVCIHLCACGCKEEIVTPLNYLGQPIGHKGWDLIQNGNLITLDPSIGNAQLKCHSHYYIKNNKVIKV